MKTLFLHTLILAVFCASAHAGTVYCTNCSDKFLQSLDRVTSLEQLAKLSAQYTEDLTQTEQQIRMVQQNIDQLDNMAVNTQNLDPYMLESMKGRFVRLGELTTQIAHQRGEADTLDRLYKVFYPSYDDMGRIVRQDTPEANAEAQRRYQEWSDQVDAATRATFQVSGSQLEELSKSGELDNHVQELLNTPKGRMGALQSANQLSAIQIDEARKMRVMLATSIQSQAQTAAKAEKKDEQDHEQWRKAFEGDVIKETIKANSDTYP